MQPFRPRLTLILIAILTAGFALVCEVAPNPGGWLPFRLDAPSDALVRFGAAVPVLVAAGQWERVVSAGFLHAFDMHLLVNVVSLFSIGALIERELGRARLLAIYLGSSIGGAWTSAAFARGPLSVGASTAIFGLLGAFAVMHIKYGDELPYGVRQSRRWWMIILLLNGGLSALVPQIDGIAHAAGFVVGGVMALIVLPRAPQMPSSRWSVLVATALALVTVIGLGRTVERARSPAWTDDVFAAETAFATHPNVTAPQLNDFAWRVAVDRNAPPRSLELALTAAERAVALQRHPAFLDTLAECEHRLLRDAKAAEIEKEALALGKSAIYATQLGRFLAGRDAMLVPSSQASSTPNAPALTSIANGKRAITLPGEAACTQLYLRAEHQGRHAALVHVFIDGTAGKIVALPPEIEARFTPEMKIVVADVSETCPAEQGTELARFTYWPRDPEVDAWP
ncbi:MAG: rhomboid family intramembrane serine protease [Deltaproteobacteria bacterium]|nr:rhomboid family intramembrane serine protease [Deltaproteobacteria bacterium]